MTFASLTPLWHFICITGILFLTFTLVKANEKGGGKTVMLKNCHCTCFDDSNVPHPDICDIATGNLSRAYTDPELRFVTRAEWNARPPVRPLVDLENPPAKYVVISHTATKSCFTKAQCVPHVRSIQNFHIESHSWLDVGYNFMVGGDGLVYIGRGWDKQGAFTHRHHESTIEISLIGTFREATPTETQLATTRKLIKVGIRENKLAKNYQLWEQKQMGLPRIERLGDHLYEIIKKWEHYDPTDQS